MTGTAGRLLTARVLATTGVAWLAVWAIFHARLPWWASALMLASASIASIEAAIIRRNVDCDE